MCKRVEDDARLNVGLPRHKHIVGFFKVPVKEPTRGHDKILRETWIRKGSYYLQKPQMFLNLWNWKKNQEHMAFLSLFRWVEVNGCLTSHATIFQWYMWRHIDVQADWRSWTYGGASNAIHISYASSTCPSKHRHGTNLFTCIPRNRPIEKPFTTCWGIRRTYSHLKPPGSPRGNTKTFSIQYDMKRNKSKCFISENSI